MTRCRQGWCADFMLWWDRTLKHVAMYSPLLTDAQKKFASAPNPNGLSVKRRLEQNPQVEPFVLSELPLFLEKKYTLDVPVYTVWGACEDVRVLEKFRSGEYRIDKLHIIDEASSRLLDVGGVKLRLLGLGGAVVMHKLFDNGEGKTTIAGGQGTMWTTVLQMGELVDTANRVYDPMETRVFVTHASPARDGLLNQLSVTLKADFSISAGLHFRYGSSYNEFSVNPTLDTYRGKLAASKASFNDVWETVKGEVQPAIAQNNIQQTYLDNALAFVEKMPSTANGAGPFGGPPSNAGQGQVDESAFKNMWNFNLADAAFGWLVLEVEGGRIGTEMKAQGFNFAHRTGKQPNNVPQQQQQQQQTASTPTTIATTTVASSSALQVNTNNASVPVPPAVPTYSAPGSMRKAQQTQQTSQGQNQGQNNNQLSPQLPQSEPVKPALPPSPAAIEAPLPAPTPSENQSTEQKPASPALSPTSPVGRKPYEQRDRKTGLYVVNAGTTEAEVKGSFPPELAEKIVEVAMKKSAIKGALYWYVYFETAEIMKDVFAKLPETMKNHSERTKPLVKEIDSEGGYIQGRGSMRDGSRIGINDSKWSRGGEPGSISRSGPQKQGGGSASESESQGFRGGRIGYRGRGDGRGSGRGRGRGGRGGIRGEDGPGSQRMET